MIEGAVAMVFEAPELRHDAELDDADDALIGRRASPRSAIRVPAIFRLGELSADVVLIDISETGARLLASCPPPAGHDGFLSWEGNSCPCRIAWSGQDSFGVSFLMAEPAIHELASRASSPGSAAPAVPSVMIPLAPQSAPRSLLPPRPPLELPAEVSQGEAWIKVVLRGISQNGFEVGWFPRCKDRARISLRGPGLPVLHGRVASSDHLLVRCKLREPLHRSVYQHIAIQLGIEA